MWGPAPTGPGPACPRRPSAMGNPCPDQTQIAFSRLPAERSGVCLIDSSLTCRPAGAAAATPRAGPRRASDDTVHSLAQAGTFR
jgi:hypothetical protein